MNNSLIVNIENFRNKERVKNLGEVFTPEEYVHKLLNVLPEKHWKDESTIFFEPSCGHGNIVIPLINKRFQLLKKKYKQNSDSTLEALAITLNTLWAIDICSKNIELCRKRVLEFIIHELKTTSLSLYNKQGKLYLSHILCSIVWQIQENETLSSLIPKITSPQLKTTQQWLKSQDQKLINFQDDWCRNFINLQKRGNTHILFKRANSFIDSIISESSSTYKEFEFSRDLIRSLVPIKKNMKIEVV